MGDLKLSERGYFWLEGATLTPEQNVPENAVSGLLTIGPDGTSTLELDDLLVGPQAYIPDSRPCELIIIGLLKGAASYVRLEHAWHKNMRLGGQTPSSESFSASTFLAGCAPIAGSSSEPCCASIRISLAGFESWLGLGAPQIRRTRMGLVAGYKQPEAHLYKLMDATLEMRTDLISKFDRRATVTLTQCGELIYTPHKPVTLDGVKNIVARIEDLFVLLTNFERSMGQPQIQIVGQTEWGDLHFSQIVRSSEDLDFLECWITFPQIAENFGAIVDLWFSRHSEFGPAFHLYLGNRRGVRLYEEHRFVNLIWGLESFHRRATDPSGTLKRNQEPSLETRISDNFLGLPIDLTKDQLHAFAKKCADRRNDISHFGGLRTQTPYDGLVLELRSLSDALDPLYHACILQKIGVSDEHIRWTFCRASGGFKVRHALRNVGLELPPVESKPPSGWWVAHQANTQRAIIVR